MVGVFALLGLFLGTIYATDPRDGFDVRDRPTIRTVVSGIIGAALSLSSEDSVRTVPSSGS